MAGASLFGFVVFDILEDSENIGPELPSTMTNLDPFVPAITRFLGDSLQSCLGAHSDHEFTSAGLLCCEWTGVLGFGMNTGDSDDVLMCRGVPDFVVLDDEELTFDEWEEEFRGDQPQFSYLGQTLEGTDQAIFEFLITVSKGWLASNPLPPGVRWFGVDLRDGNGTEFWEVNRDHPLSPSAPPSSWPDPLKVGPGIPVFVPSGDQLLQFGDPASLWNLTARAKAWTRRLMRKGRRCVFSQDGSMIAVSTERNGVAVLAFPDMSEIARWDHPDGTSSTSGLAFSPCGKYVVQGTGSSTGGAVLEVHAASSGELIMEERYDDATIQNLHACDSGSTILWSYFARAERNHHWYMRTWPFECGCPGTRLPVDFPSKIDGISPSGRLVLVRRFEREAVDGRNYWLDILTAPDLVPAIQGGSSIGGFKSLRISSIDPAERVLIIPAEGQFEIRDLKTLSLIRSIRAKYAETAIFSADGQYVALVATTVEILRTSSLLAGD